MKKNKKKRRLKKARNWSSLPTTPWVIYNSSIWTRYRQTRQTVKRIAREGPYSELATFHKKSSTPFFSVMVITYNHEDYIADAIESILTQKRNFSLEINVIDDASTDRTQEIVKGYKKRFPGIINCYFNKKNVGKKASQINTFRGFQSLRGKYFSLLEGDDFWTDNNKLMLQVEFLEKNQEYVACAHNTLKIFDDYRPPEHFLPFKGFGRNTADLHDLVHMNGVFHLSSIVYRNIFGSSPPYCLVDPYSCEITINMVYGCYGKFYCIDKNMSGYRVHAGGSFSTKSQEDIWLFHLYGYTRFGLYLGPAHYLLFTSAILKFSSYVLRATKNDVVESLRPSTWSIFLIHAGLSLPFAMIRRTFVRISNFFDNPYVTVAALTPYSVQKFVFKVEKYLPFIKTFRLGLKYFDWSKLR